MILHIKKLHFVLSILIGMQAYPIFSQSNTTTKKNNIQWKKVIPPALLGALALGGLFYLGTYIKSKDYTGTDISPFDDFVKGLRYKNFLNSPQNKSYSFTYTGILSILGLFNPKIIVYALVRDYIVRCPHNTAYPMCYKVGNLTTIGLLVTLISLLSINEEEEKKAEPTEKINDEIPATSKEMNKN